MSNLTVAKNCSPVNNPFTPSFSLCLGFFLALGAWSGCKTIGNLGTPQHTPAALTASEAEEQLQRGWILFQHQPQTISRVTEAAHMMETSAQALPGNFDAQVRAARAQAYLSERESDKAARKKAAEHGIALAKRARELDPKRVEGHYLYALTVGLLADVDREYGLDAVGEMVAALKIAIDIDGAYENGGPLRLLGLLHLRTPPPPISVGSKRKAQQLFQRAVDLCPQYPENYLYLAEAQRDLHRDDDARSSLQKVLDLPAPAGHGEEAEQWRKRAKELLESLNQSTD
jgi:hypothetical protein